MTSHDSARAVLLQLAHSAIAAAAPAACIPHHLPDPPRGRTLVVGAGKAAAAMAHAVEEHWPATQRLEGVVVTRYGHAVPCRRIEVVEAAHPVPDDGGLQAGRRILERVRGLGPDDLVLALLSGGASALLAVPAPGLTLQDKQVVGRALLRSGASIHAMNTVRRHLSAIKGGRLAVAAAPARVVTLAISDVPGDDPAVIGSGPTVADPTTREEALAILQKFAIPAPAAVLAHLARAEAETPKPGDPRLSGHTVQVVARARDALEAAAGQARRLGLTPHALGEAIEGEAAAVGAAHAERALAVARGEGPVAPPCVLLSGGETTVTVRGTGRGGRNTEYLLALTCALGGDRRIHAVAIDTDGIDGTESAAGAITGPDTLRRAAAAGLDARARLAANDAWSVFHALDDLVITGPTLTNVNDFRAILVTA